MRIEVVIKGNHVNLCDSCSKTLPECDAMASDVMMGDGKGKDNICMCSKYKPLKWRSGDGGFDQSQECGGAAQEVHMGQDTEGGPCGTHEDPG